MRDYRDGDHIEEYRRQEIEDMEFLMRQDYEANKRCGNCVWYRKGTCVCLTSPYMGSERRSRDFECVEWEYEDYE